jgi:hypothetical protein
MSACGLTMNTMTEILQVRDMSASPGLVSNAAFGRLGFRVKINEEDAKSAYGNSVLHTTYEME